jgi:small subunit ribosomal protein S4
VNGKKLDIPSYQVCAGDVIKIGDRASSQQLGLRMLDLTQSVPLQDWLTLDREKMEGTVSRLPEKEDIDPPVNLQLIVELYSR